MPKIATTTLLALQDELPKIASLASWGAAASGVIHGAAGKKALGLAGALGGHGAAVGAGLGGLYKGYKSYSDARDQGADVGSALAHGVGGAIGGASQGALLGGIAGAGVGGALGHFHPDAAAVEKLRGALSTDKHWSGAVGRFGQRQMHGLTGWTPEKGLESIRGGSWAAEKNVKDLVAGGKGGTPELAKARKVVGVERDMQARGLTHVPGIIKALSGKDRVGTLKAMAAHQWGAASPAQKAMVASMTALPLLPLLSASGRDSANAGEQTGGALGGTAGAIVGSALPFYAQNKAMQAGTYVGGKLGKGVDWVRGKHRSLPDERDQSGMDGQNYPGERIPMSAGSNGVMQ